MSVRHIGMAYEKPRKAYMYTVHIRMEGRGICEKLKPRNPLSTTVAVEVCAPESKTPKSANAEGKDRETKDRWKSTYSLNESYKNL
jgi:hypothetical protein